MSQAATAGAAPRVTEAPVRSRRINRALLRPILMLGGILLVAVASGAYWLSGGRYVSIDDAYVRAAKETLSTDVSGIVAAVLVHEGQHVKKGDVLLRLDPQQFQIMLDSAKASLTGVVTSVGAMKLDYQRLLGDVEVKQSQVQSDQANFERYSNLVKSGGVTRADYDNMRFQLAANQRAVSALKTMAEVQRAKLLGNPDVDVRTMPEYLQAKARVDEAQRELDHAVIYAPFDGIVTQVDTVQPGMYLAASTAAFGIVSTEDVWVEANPKET
ncbi:MAG: biotin/lipoyl-binding protein, partial [Acetobacteraceae bacterium]